MYTLEVFRIADDHFGYKIFDDDFNNYIIYQEFDPDLPGFEKMSADIALEKGNIVLGRVCTKLVQVQENEKSYMAQIPVETAVGVPWGFGAITFLTERFTDQERASLMEMQKKTQLSYEEKVQNGEEVPEDLQKLYEFFVLWEKATIVDLKFGPTINGIKAVGAILGFSEERINQILSY